MYLPSLSPNHRRGWTSYTNGNYVKDLVFDRDGKLWVASAGGVVRWDLESHESVQYHAEDGLASNRVFSAAMDADGKLWFGTDAGVSRFDGSNWTTFSSSDGLIDNEVDAIEAGKDGSIWFGTPLGASRFDCQKWTSFDDTNGLGGIQTISIDSHGHLWFGTKESGAVYYDGRTFTRFTSYDGLVDDGILSSAVTPDGAVWFGTIYGVSRFDGGVWTTYTTKDGLLTDDVYAISAAADGSLWFGAYDGVTHFDGKTWKSFQVDRSSNEGVWIQAAAVSTNGAIWIGTYSRGIFGLLDGNWVNLMVDAGVLHNEISVLDVLPDGTVWVGYLSGISKYEDHMWYPFRFSDKVTAQISWPWAILSTPGGQVWVGTSDGLIEINGQDWDYYLGQDGLAPYSIGTIAVTVQGDLWLGTRSGIIRHNQDGWKKFSKETGLLDNEICCIAAAADDTLWVAYSLVPGLSHFDGKKWTHYSLPLGEYVSAYALALLQDGSIWLGTSDGVYHLKVEADGIDATHYTEADGLAGMQIYSIAVASDGSIWFGTDQGISHFDGGTWRSFNSHTGLAANRASEIASGSDGSIWVRTDGGLSHYVP